MINAGKQAHSYDPLPVLLFARIVEEAVPLF